MQIRLYNYSVLARDLTWEQVQEAISLARAGEAGKHFRFYEHLDDQATHPVKRWQLLSMPNIYWETTFEGKDKTGWFISIPGYHSQAKHPAYSDRDRARV